MTTIELTKTESQHQYNLAVTRSAGSCESCGRPAQSVHHRLSRDRLGVTVVANLLVLCGTDVTAGCHGLAHSGYHGQATGLSLPFGTDPTVLPYFRTIDRTWRIPRHDHLEHVNTQTAIELLTLHRAIRTGLNG